MPDEIHTEVTKRVIEFALDIWIKLSSVIAQTKASSQMRKQRLIDIGTHLSRRNGISFLHRSRVNQSSRKQTMSGELQEDEVRGSRSQYPRYTSCSTTHELQMQIAYHSGWHHVSTEKRCARCRSVSFLPSSRNPYLPTKYSVTTLQSNKSKSSLSNPHTALSPSSLLSFFSYPSSSRCPRSETSPS